MHAVMMPGLGNGHEHESFKIINQDCVSRSIQKAPMGYMGLAPPAERAQCVLVAQIRKI